MINRSCINNKVRLAFIYIGRFLQTGSVRTSLQSTDMENELPADFCSPDKSVKGLIFCEFMHITTFLCFLHIVTYI